MFDEDVLPKRKPVHDIPIAPILDMLVAVIFFLLLTTSFISITQQGIPPSIVAETELDANAEPPLAPKIVVSRFQGGLRLTLRWSGSHPGQVSRDVRNPGNGDFSVALLHECEWIADYFARQFPTLTSVQIGFTANVVYQDVITVMDGVRKKVPDIVLMSYTDTAQILGGRNGF
jgi:biopolymer transport protein ExbD